MQIGYYENYYEIQEDIRLNMTYLNSFLPTIIWQIEVTQRKTVKYIHCLDISIKWAISLKEMTRTYSSFFSHAKCRLLTINQCWSINKSDL